MRKYLFVIFIVLVGFNINDVQKEHIKLNWEFNFTGESKLDNPVISFANAAFSGDQQIPVFIKSFQLKNKSQNFRFVVENPTFKELESTIDFPFNFELAEEIKIETTNLISGNDRVLQLQIVPFIKRNNKILVLQNFELKQIPVKVKSLETENYSWKSESVLKSGNWRKIKTNGKGIYKIPYSLLSEWGFSAPANVNVFGSGGTILSEKPAEIAYDDLIQSTVWHGKNNGIDCLFFYEPGNVEWNPDNSNSFFEHVNNNYSKNGYFFLTEDVGTQKIIEVQTPIQESVTHSVSDFNAYNLYEADLQNLIFSGKKWFGQKFVHGTTKNYSFNIQNAVNNSDVSILVQATARSFIATEMPVSTTFGSLGKLDFTKVNTGENTALYADLRSKRFTTTFQSNELDINVKYFAVGTDNFTDDNAESWLDYIELNFRKKIVVENNALFFRDLASVGINNIVEFNIGNTATNTKLWDVTNMNVIKEVPLQTSGNISKAKCRTDKLNEYVVFNPNGEFPEPAFVAEIENQNLHAKNTPELLIISHSNFLNSANELADFHRSYDGMNVEVVDADKVYNEFSSGSKDATGIRNFIKMFYDRNNGLKYVLLFGDGSYDNKKIHDESSNFIPTFQSENSLNPVASFVTDDYFVILDKSESVYNGAVDLGIGRIPASTTYEAELVVNKILNYYKPNALGNWRNVICFIGDDEDGGLHMSDSEKLAKQVNALHKEFVTNKIYFDSYLQESIAGVERYPEVTDAINKRVKEGVLVLNYVGHANDRFMADEHVLDISNINSWSNSKNLPIFVTATCEFSRFDADDTSAGEYVLFNPNGGGIGLFSTTRVVFAYSNFLLSRSFYSFVFEKDNNGDHYRMGDIMRLAKVNTINTTNKRNFSLLADPALKLSYPANKIETLSINQQNAAGTPDTIGALQKITVSGQIIDNLGNKLNNFSGEITPTVYDKLVKMKTLGNGGEKPMEFEVQENIIYKGLAKVTNGDFTFSFVIPKDISYNLGRGKVVYYADNGETDAHGAFENFVIGGKSGNQIVDNQGPDIELYMDSENFVSGNVTSKNPTMLAFLSDENGINTVVTVIGHDITAVLDNDYSNIIVLNNFYQSNIDDYTSGILQFPFKDLSVGEHTLKLKAWDVANNSSEVEITFNVSGEFNITGISNYPNPVSDYTFFTFEHNQSDATLNIIVEIFDRNGSRIDYFTTEVGSDGLNSNPVRWNVNDLNIKLRSGIYVYRITAQNNDNEITSKSGKFVVVR